MNYYDGLKMVLSKEINKLKNPTKEQFTFYLGYISFLIIQVCNIENKSINAVPYIFGFFAFSMWLYELRNIHPKNYYTKILINSFFSGVVILIITYNLSISDMAVNLFLEVPSSAFLYTRTLTSIYMFPYVLSLMLIFISITSLVIIFISMKDMNLMMKNIFKNSSLNLINRVSFFIVMANLSGDFINNSIEYTEYMENKIKSFAYELEMESYTYCDIPKGAKVAYVTRDIIVIGQKVNGEYLFKTAKCNEKLK